MAVKGENGNYSASEGDRQNYRSQLENCDVYEEPGFCDADASLREVRLYKEGRDRFYESSCGGCGYFAGFMEQWRQDLVEFHELLHGTNTVTGSE